MEDPFAPPKKAPAVEDPFAAPVAVVDPFATPAPASTDGLPDTWEGRSLQQWLAEGKPASAFGRTPVPFDSSLQAARDREIAMMPPEPDWIQALRAKGTAAYQKALAEHPIATRIQSYIGQGLEGLGVPRANQLDILK